MNDSLGICADLERQMDALVATYRCEWAEVVKDPEKRAAFPPLRQLRRRRSDDRARAGARSAASGGLARAAAAAAKPRLPIVDRRWVPLASADSVPKEGGIAVKYGNAQLAIFNFASRGAWYATQNMCPHRKDMVLARGIIGDQSGTPKVACPLHKKTFALDSGQCLSGDAYAIATFPVKVEDGLVYVELPPAQQLETALCAREHARKEPSMPPSSRARCAARQRRGVAVLSAAQRALVRLPIIDRYLEEQQQLTAVERFSRAHDDARARARRVTAS